MQKIILIQNQIIQKVIELFNAKIILMQNQIIQWKIQIQY